MVSEREIVAGVATTTGRPDSAGVTRRALLGRGAGLGLSAALVGSGLLRGGSAVLASSAPTSELTTLGFSHPYPGSDIYIPLRKGLREEAEAREVEVLESQADGLADRQLAELNTWIEAGVQAISILNINGEGLAPVVERAHERGIKIIGYANHIDGEDGYNVFDNVQGAELVAAEAERWINENLPGDDPIEVGLLTLDVLETGSVRVHHAFDTLKERVPRVEVVASAEGTNLAAPALEATRAMIQQHPDIRMMICISDDGELGAYQALRAVGKEKDVWLAGYDGARAAIELLAAGEMIGCTASIPLRDIGAANVWVAANLLSGVGDTFFEAPYILVTNDTPDVAEELLADFDVESGSSTSVPG